MAGETTITIIGNLTADPELRFTPSGAAVASFTVASTPRTFNKQNQQWEDGEAMFLTCSVWRDYAEHVAESLQKGMRVIVQGRLKSRSYEKDGQKRTVFEVDVDEVGPSLRYATAQVTRTQQNSQGGGQQQGWQQPQGQQGGWNPPPAAQTGGWQQPAGGQAPWANQQQPPQQNNQGGWQQPPASGQQRQAPYSGQQQGQPGQTLMDQPPF